MARSLLLTFILLGTIFIGWVNATFALSLSANAETSICTAPQYSKQSLDSLSTGASTSVEFDASSTFYDRVNSEFTQILVKKGDGTQPFRFVYIGAGSVRQEIGCAGTKDYTFARLINNFLFMKKTGSPDRYYVCRLLLSDLTNSVTILPTTILAQPKGNTSAITECVPFSVRETTDNTQWDIYVACKDASSTVINKYLWSTINSDSVLIGSAISGSFTTFDGVEHIFYDATNGFGVLDTSGAPTYQLNTNTPPNPVAGNIITLYRTSTINSLIGIYSSNKQTANLYLVYKDTSLHIDAVSDFTGSSGTAFVDFYDESNNVMLISDTQVIWLNFGLDGTIKKIVSPIASMPISNLQSVTFSGDLAMFTHSDKIVYYQITANDAVTKVFQHIHKGPITLPTGDYSKKYWFTCFCQLIQQTLLFASTLSSLVIKKGAERCGNDAALFP